MWRPEGPEPEALGRHKSSFQLRPPQGLLTAPYFQILLRVLSYYSASLPRIGAVSSNEKNDKCL